MNYLNKTKAYLVGHMQYLGGKCWRKVVAAELEPLGITCFDPYDKPFIYGVEEDDNTRAEISRRSKSGHPEDIVWVDNKMREIRSYDLNLVDRCDFIISHISPTIASWGSAEELEWACRLKKPVFISVEGGRFNTPLWLRGMFTFDNYFDCVEDVIEKIKEINSGGEIDHKRWRLLKEEYR